MWYIHNIELNDLLDLMDIIKDGVPELDTNDFIKLLHSIFSGCDSVVWRSFKYDETKNVCSLNKITRDVYEFKVFGIRDYTKIIDFRILIK